MDAGGESAAPVRESGSPPVLDISVALADGTEPWPGDAPFELSWSGRIADGDSVNVAAIRSSVHNGTHVDAPLHVTERGAAVDALDLAAFVGPAVVLDREAVVRSSADELAGRIRHGDRVLLASGRRDFRRFPADVAGVPVRTVEALAELGVPLVGTDEPSLDPVDSEGLPAHRACVRHRIVILENLVLHRVEPGRYDLVALPLRLEGADAAPVRAVLFPEGSTRRETAT